MRLAFIAIILGVTLYIGVGVVSKISELSNAQAAKINAALSNTK